MLMTGITWYKFVVRFRKELYGKWFRAEWAKKCVNQAKTITAYSVSAGVSDDSIKLIDD